MVGGDSNVLEDVGADEEVRIIGEGDRRWCRCLPGAAERVEGVEQIDVGHRDCNGAERLLQEDGRALPSSPAVSAA